MNDDQTEEEKGVFALHDAVAELREKKNVRSIRRLVEDLPEIT